MAVEKCGSTRPPRPRTRRRIFEQPLNERLRTFLRLDFLYTQALYHNEMASQWGSRAAMALPAGRARHQPPAATSARMC